MSDIRQGDIFWIDFEDPKGSEQGYRHPCVVVQNNLFNASRLGTTVVCALTSNLERAKAPGNVVLKKGEGNLSGDAEKVLRSSRRRPERERCSPP